MTAKQDSIRVAFRVARDDKRAEVTAVLPDLPANPGNWVCYAHIGQHGECSHAWYNQNTRPAKPREYAPLLAELTQIYSAEPDAVALRVVRRIQR